MHLAFCIFKYFPHGGLQRDFLHIAKLCQRKGHSITVFTMDWHGPRPAHFDIRIVKVSAFSNHGKSYQFAKRVNAALEQQSFDAVIGFNRMPGLDVYLAGDVCFADREEKRNKSKMSRRYRCYQALEQAVFGIETNTKILSISPREQKKYQQHYQTPSERFILLPPGVKKHDVDLNLRSNAQSELRQKFGLSKQDNIVLMVGSHFDTKGVDRAIKALSSLDKPLQAQTHLIIVGKGKPKSYIRQANALGIAAQVHFYGECNDVLPFMIGADLLLHCAYHEAAGKVLVEALVAGLPVVVTANCGYAFHIAQAEAGMVVPEPFSQSNLNQALQQALISKQHDVWQRNALSYAANTDLYGLPDKVVQVIESVGETYK